MSKIFVVLAVFHYFSLRSNFNSRELNSRELFRFFGHNSGPSGAFLTKIGGNFPSVYGNLRSNFNSRGVNSRELFCFFVITRDQPERF